MALTDAYLPITKNQSNNFVITTKSKGFIDEKDRKLNKEAEPLTEDKQDSPEACKWNPGMKLRIFRFNQKIV